MARIGILGGAFDPPHLVHMMIAEQTAEGLGLDRVLFIPTGVPPHGKHPEASPRRRFLMTTAAIGDHMDLFSASRYEVDRVPDTSFMVDTLEWVASDHPGDELYLILGDDQLATLHQWHDFRRLLDLARVICVQREEWDPDLQMPTWYAMDMDVNPIFISCPTTFWSLSSTTIRERVRKGLSIRYMVPEPVRHCIDDWGLYRVSPSA
jgi:nicotinate-nucleotide adenylyltransferase